MIGEDGEFVREEGSIPLYEDDALTFKAEIDRIGAKSILEFGPGESTQIFLALGMERIVTCEHKEKWLKPAQERFANEPKVRVLQYTDTDPVEVPELGDETFDIAFVDSPQGFRAMRKVHPGMEDCSRLNTCLFALQRANVVILHDARRPLERGTLGRLNAMGYHFELIGHKMTSARIEGKNVTRQNGADTSRSKKPRRSAPGAKPKRGRVPECVGPSGHVAGGVEAS